MIITSDLLIKRALYKQGISLLTKARNLAKKYERLHYCLLIDQKIYVAQNTIRNFDHWSYFVNEYPKEEFEPIMEKIKREHEIDITGGRIQLLQATNDGFFRKQESLEELDKLYLPLIEKGEDYPPTFISKLQYYTTLGFYYMHRDIEKSVYYCEKAVELIESRSEFYSLRYMTHIVCIGNLLLLYALTRRFEEMRKLLNKLMGISPFDKSHRNAINETYLHFETTYCRICIDYPQRRKVIRKIDNDFSKRTPPISRSRLSLIASNLAMNYFIDHNFKKSLEWLNRMDEWQDLNTEKTFILVHRLFRLILYYEMEKFDLLLYSITNTYRSLLHNKLLFPFEKVIIKLLEKLMETANLKLRTKLLETTLQEINRMQQEESLKLIFELFNFPGWIKCKISGKKFTEMLAD